MTIPTGTMTADIAIGDRVSVVAPGCDGLVGTVVAIEPTFAGGLANPWPDVIECVDATGNAYRLRLAASEVRRVTDGEGAG